MTIPKTATLVALLGACSHAPEHKNDPLSGSINGTSFDVIGSYAEVRNDVLYVTLVNTTSACGAFPQPTASLLRLDLTVPPQAQRIGSFPLGADEQSPRLAITSFTEANGMLRQNSSIIETGSLEVREIGTSLSGSLAITTSKAALSGVFSTEICR
jgi:hypothetical protein